MSDLDLDTVLCDVILLTHGHGDHVGDTERIALRTNPLSIPLIKHDPNDFLALLDAGVGLIMQPGDFISL